MKIFKCEQGSPEWFAARAGIPTASCFDKIITPTGKLSTQADAYAKTLLAEWLCHGRVESFTSEWMTRGTELEPQARAYYELQADADVVQVGFTTTTTDAGTVGASPDGLVGDDGLLELKCPAPYTHVGYMLDGKLPTKYRPQVHGQLYVTDRDWCDFLSFHPLMDPVLIRVERDDKYIAAIADALGGFLETLAAMKAQLEARGITPLKDVV